MRSLIYFVVFLIFCSLFSSCDQQQQGPRPLEAILRGPVSVQLNPHGKVPLGALLNFVTKEDCKVDVEVEGSTPVKRTFSSFSKYHETPVIGLYADTLNKVGIQLTTSDGKVYSGEVQIKTDPLPAFFPTIDIARIERDKMEPGFHMIEMLIANNGKFLTYTILFDDSGAVRWFMDMSENGQITYTTYRLRNGNWLYLSWINIIEVDDLGKVIKKEQMWGHAGDHDVVELADGTLLMGGSKKDSKILRGDKAYPSRFDFVIIWDRKGQGRTLKEWDLRTVLDVDRMVFRPDYTIDFNSDWFHLNSVDQNLKDKSILVSGRNQGVLKVDKDNKLQWILAPHKAWGRSGYDGKGFETSEYLLTAVDADKKPLPRAVQEGRAGVESFEWSTGQHAAQFLDNGNILLFDNGLMRNFETKPTYSRAVEYRIDEENKTIQQVWQYGKSRGLEMFSPITSDVDVLPKTGNRLITSGNVRASALPPHAKMLEVTYPDNREVFEANIFFKDALGTQAREWAQFDVVYRGERYFLTPPANEGEGE